MSIAARKLTYADFVRIPDDGKRHEIIEGEEFVTPAPGLDHQAVVGKLYRILSDYVEAHNLGRVFISPTDVLFSRHNIVEPDLLFVSRQRVSILKGRKNVRGAPDLLIEVSSPSTVAFDRGKKLDLYSRKGVREYWIVDLFARTFEVHEFGRRRRTTVWQEEQSFESALLPGLRINIDAVFSAAR